MAKYNQVISDFYCLNCGNKGLPVYRPKAKIREKGHRKALYCIHCKTEVNHYECRNIEEVQTFKTAFLEGLFKEEAIKSMEFIKQEKGSMII